MSSKPLKTKTAADPHAMSSSDASSQMSGASAEAKTLLVTASKYRKGKFVNFVLRFRFGNKT